MIRAYQAHVIPFNYRGIYLVPPTGIEPVSPGLHSGAMTTSAKAAKKLFRGDQRGSNPYYQSHSLGCYHYNMATPKKSYIKIGSEQGIRTLVPLYGTHSLAGRHDKPDSVSSLY